MELSSSLLQGLFLIMLTIFGGEVGNTFSCQTMKYLRSHVVIKHIVIICLIYFTVDYVRCLSFLFSLINKKETFFMGKQKWCCFRHSAFCGANLWF